MTPKIGRNDPCWCGSGKKYKKCHINRTDQDVVRPWEVDAHFRQRAEKGACLHVGATAEASAVKPRLALTPFPERCCDRSLRTATYTISRQPCRTWK